MKQKDFNWLAGYSSVAHMGFVFLGIATLNLIGVTGAVLVMIAHGFLAALIFGLNGYLYHQTGTLQMDQLGGLARRLPFIGTRPGHGRLRRLRPARLRQLRRRGDRPVWRLARLPGGDDTGLLGRPDHRGRLYAAGDPRDPLRTAA